MKRKRTHIVKMCVIMALIALFATNALGQTKWTKYEDNPVLDSGTPDEWDEDDVFSSTVLFDGAEYQMWYSGTARGSHWRIGYATSADGIVWKKHPDNPVLDLGEDGTWDDYHVFGPTVLFDGTKYQMWYAGYDGSHRRIGYATSADGIVWVKHPGNPVLKPGASGEWDDYYVFEPTVLFDGTKYQMWYSGCSSHQSIGDAMSPDHRRIGYATSADGIVWVKHPGNPVLDLGEGGTWDDYHVSDPMVLFDGAEYQMWYGGNDGSHRRIGYATGADGIVWKKHSDNPVLDLGDIGTWEDKHVCDPTILFDGTKYQMWYLGGDGSKTRIGYATSIPILPTIFNVHPNYGYTIGGTEISITGENFQDGAIVTIGGNLATNVTNPIETEASITSMPIDITDEAPEMAHLSITLEVSNPITKVISFSTSQLNVAMLELLIQTAIDDAFGQDYIVVAVTGSDTSAIVTFTTVAIGSGVRLTVGQLAGSDILFPGSITNFGGLTIHAITPAGAFGSKDVVVTNPDGYEGILYNGFSYIHITGDVSGDDTVSAYDAALILQYVVGIINQFPADSPISQAAQKFIAAEITIEELDRILQKLGYPPVFSLFRRENRLLQNYPNPFNPETWIPFQLAQNAPVSISIYNVKGQLIRTIDLVNNKAGIYVTKDKAAYWDGRDSLGEKVASGVYYYTLQVGAAIPQIGAGNIIATRKMVIVK